MSHILGLDFMIKEKYVACVTLSVLVGLLERFGDLSSGW